MIRVRPPVDTVTLFFGDLNSWPTEPDGINLTQGQIKAVCAHVDATGDCLWHAQYVVLGWKSCSCAKCNHGRVR